MNAEKSNDQSNTIVLVNITQVSKTSEASTDNETKEVIEEQNVAINSKIDPKSLNHCNLCNFKGCDQLQYEKHLDSDSHRSHLRAQSNVGSYLPGEDEDDESDTEKELVIDLIMKLIMRQWQQKSVIKN